MLIPTSDTIPGENGAGALEAGPKRSLSSSLSEWLDGSHVLDSIGAALHHLDSSLAQQANAATSVLSTLRYRYADRRRWRAYQRNIARWKLAPV